METNLEIGGGSFASSESDIPDRSIILSGHELLEKNIPFVATRRKEGRKKGGCGCLFYGFAGFCGVGSLVADTLLL